MTAHVNIVCRAPTSLLIVERLDDGLAAAGRPISPEQARNKVRSGKDVFAADRKTAEEIAGRGSVGPEIHRAGGTVRFPHFHLPNREGGHIFFGPGISDLSPRFVR